MESVKYNRLNRFIPPGSLDFATKDRRPAMGNAFVKWHTIPVEIKRYFTDVDGAVVAKATVPAALQTRYPFFVFGDFDREGGYNTGLKAMPLPVGVEYLTTFVNANGITSQQITGFTGLNTIKNFIDRGDIVIVYTDNSVAPNYFIWIVIKNNYGALSSIVGNSETTQRDGLIGKVYLEMFKYFTDNQAQWELPVHFTRSSNIATWSDNQVQPYIFKTPYTFQNGFIDMKCNFNLDQYQSLATYFLYETESISWNFKLATS